MIRSVNVEDQELAGKSIHLATQENLYVNFQHQTPIRIILF